MEKPGDQPPSLPARLEWRWRHRGKHSVEDGMDCDGCLENPCGTEEAEGPQGTHG